jgi:phosphoserine phosphatase
VEFKRRNDEFYAHYVAGTLDVHDYVRFAVEALRARGAAAYEQAHARFMRDWIAPALRPPRWTWCAATSSGRPVAIVTATNELVTRPIAPAFGVPELIAVELERDASAGSPARSPACPPCAKARWCA